jgi:2-aminoadipate transaminase
MDYSFASRMKTTPKSFIREILKVTDNPEIISFAGGLPNPDLFDTGRLADVAHNVIAKEGKAALQYTTTEGYLPLRQFIADRYKKRLGMTVSPDEILITNGSQQCLDLIGKVFLDKGDIVAIERPGYLGAIQAFSLYEPRFSGIPLKTDGPDVAELRALLDRGTPKIFYSVPNSQNPSGITWSAERRSEVAELVRESSTVFIEDDAYGELRFDGNPRVPLYSLLPGQAVMTGSFSKIVAPGLRVGWVVAPEEIMEQIVIAKQASDLHSNHVAQRIIARYLTEYSIDDHIPRIVDRYRRQRDVMVDCVKNYFPEGVFCPKPDGGMFLWVELPAGCSSMELFSRALLERVAVLPGKPFYTDGGGDNTLRLNFSNQSEDRIREGMSRLLKVIREYLLEKERV